MQALTVPHPPDGVRPAHSGVIGVRHEQHVKVLVVLDERAYDLHRLREVHVLVHLAVDQEQLALQVGGVVRVGRGLVVVRFVALRADELPVVCWQQQQPAGSADIEPNLQLASAHVSPQPALYPRLSWLPIDRPSDLNHHARQRNAERTHLPQKLTATLKNSGN